MAGIKVCQGNLLQSQPQAEAELNGQGKWTGQFVVAGSGFTRTIVLYTPLRTPTAALDAILAAGPAFGR
jgi:hypothetical protein